MAKKAIIDFDEKKLYYRTEKHIAFEVRVV